jgi:hypothetical protein
VASGIATNGVNGSSGPAAGGGRMKEAKSSGLIGIEDHIYGTLSRRNDSHEFSSFLETPPSVLSTTRDGREVRDDRPVQWVDLCTHAACLRMMANNPSPEVVLRITIAERDDCFKTPLERAFASVHQSYEERDHAYIPRYLPLGQL